MSLLRPVFVVASCIGFAFLSASCKTSEPARARVEVRAPQPSPTTFPKTTNQVAVKQLWYAMASKRIAEERWYAAATANARAVEEHQVRAAQGASRRPVAAAPAITLNNGSCGGSLPSCCTLHYESGGNPEAVEPGHAGASRGDPGDPWHHASGKWQFMPGTWNGYGGYPYAAAAPESVQDEKARQVFAGGAGASNWYGDGCYGGR